MQASVAHRNFGILGQRHFAVFAVYFLALLLFLATGLVSPSFLTANHTWTSLILASFLGILAISQTTVILLGGIDLSVPWTITTSAIMVGSLGADHPLSLSIAAALVVCLLVGLINGLGVTFLGLSPIIMTLAMNGIEQGAVSYKTGGSGFISAPPNLVNAINGTFLGIPAMVFIWVALAAVTIGLLGLTTYGRRLFATGANIRVAYLSGVNVRLVIVVAYMLSALVAGLDGVFLAGYVTQSYIGMGDTYLFPSIAAVVVGGVSIYGGQGGYLGPLGGALVLTFLDFLLAALGLATNTQQIVFGVVLLAAIAIPRLRGATSE
jgi:ribose transport system permease protein